MKSYDICYRNDGQAFYGFELLVVLGVTLAFSVLCCAASAQESPSALAGPKVEVATTRMSLVKLDFDGRLKILDERPERAALDLLTLTEAEREATRRILQQRAIDVSDLLSQHQALFLKIQTSRQGMAGGGTRSEKPESELSAYMREFRPLADHLLNPPLLDVLSGVLTKENSKKFSQLVHEYNTAVLTERNSTPREGSDSGARMAGESGQQDSSKTDSRSREKGVDESRGSLSPMQLNRMEMNALLREMAKSLSSMVQERREKTEELIKTLDLTPEQEAKIRKIIRGQGERGGLNPTREDQREMWRLILVELTADQRVKAQAYRNRK